ncbi:hypothetical protein, partial [Kibdelosporangium philippinense]|uniref:hypothetical protein n=1 Tax=Kibdelosporangium philippinense TaxID=211113 RepID=UPI0036170924
TGGGRTARRTTCPLPGSVSAMMTHPARADPCMTQLHERGNPDKIRVAAPWLARTCSAAAASSDAG